MKPLVEVALVGNQVSILDQHFISQCFVNTWHQNGWDWEVPYIIPQMWLMMSPSVFYSLTVFYKSPSNFLITNFLPSSLNLLPCFPACWKEGVAILSEHTWAIWCRGGPGLRAVAELQKAQSYAAPSCLAQHLWPLSLFSSWTVSFLECQCLRVRGYFSSPWYLILIQPRYPK